MLRGALLNIFIVNTPYHLLITTTLHTKNDLVIIIDDFNVEKSTFCSDLIEKKMKENKIIIIKGLRSFRGKPLNLFRYIREIKKRAKNINANFDGNLFLFNDGNPFNQIFISNLRNSRDVILIEEGIGLYRDVKKRHHFLYDVIGKSIFGLSFQNTRRIGGHKNTSIIVCNLPECLSDIQLEKEIFLINEFCSIDKNFLSSLNKTIPKEKFDIFISQPLVEDGVLPENLYIKKLDSIFKKVIRKNHNFYIKPHPRESKNKYTYFEKKYGVKIVEDKDIPIEIFLSNQDSSFVYTVYSSAFYNIAKYLKLDNFLLYDLFAIDPKLPEPMLKSSQVNVIKSLSELPIKKEN
ncbi:hypothetical protein AV656_08290 [Bhargavaea cecembensis]|uniref:Uncharacterized protein n=1 Tax=Bhargavaea cecembensis TaxID=394098 RepID=A0A165H649_9BACL|nr:polysialyltransferase family glycosyltransferase [Bhargavaea cecembensis]KZE38889.1 hypothetical protein AV656_08290 [Bhargavaea cecembensis]